MTWMMRDSGGASSAVHALRRYTRVNESNAYWADKKPHREFAVTVD